MQTIIAHAAQQANITRAAIRQPLGSNARVTIAVVDAAGKVLGVFRQLDAPVFGFDVSVQKARTAAFFSSANAGTLLRGAGFSSYADRAAADGLSLDGSIAFTDRAVGFLHRPFFPDGINNTAAGPFSSALSEWSPFNVGLQLDLIKTNLLAAIGGAAVPCSTIPNLAERHSDFSGQRSALQKRRAGRRDRHQRRRRGPGRPDRRGRRQWLCACAGDSLRSGFCARRASAVPEVSAQPKS